MGQSVLRSDSNLTCPLPLPLKLALELVLKLSGSPTFSLWKIAIPFLVFLFLMWALWSVSLCTTLNFLWYSTRMFLVLLQDLAGYVIILNTGPGV